MHLCICVFVRLSFLLILRTEPKEKSQPSRLLAKRSPVLSHSVRKKGLEIDTKIDANPARIVPIKDWPPGKDPNPILTETEEKQTHQRRSR